MRFRVYSRSIALAPQANKVEKFLAACAAGRWVLSPSYVHECHRAGGFQGVSEAAHELSPAMGDERCKGSSVLKAVPKRCRLLVSERDGAGMFSGWRAVVAITDERRRGIVERVLQAGGAQVSASPSLLPVSWRGAAPHVPRMTHEGLVRVGHGVPEAGPRGARGAARLLR